MTADHGTSPIPNENVLVSETLQSKVNLCTTMGNTKRQQSAMLKAEVNYFQERLKWCNPTKRFYINMITSDIDINSILIDTRK